MAKRMVSNFAMVIRLFEILKMFYPPEGLCGAEPKGVQLFLLRFYWCRKRSRGFQFTGGFLPF